MIERHIGFLFFNLQLWGFEFLKTNRNIDLYTFIKQCFFIFVYYIILLVLYALTRLLPPIYLASYLAIYHTIIFIIYIKSVKKIKNDSVKRVENDMLIYSVLLSL